MVGGGGATNQKPALSFYDAVDIFGSGDSLGNGSLCMRWRALGGVYGGCDIDWSGFVFSTFVCPLRSFKFQFHTVLYM